MFYLGFRDAFDFRRDGSNGAVSKHNINSILETIKKETKLQKRLIYIDNNLFLQVMIGIHN